MTAGSVTVLMPAFMESARIAASVRAARAIAGVTRVLVIDDGSSDDTAIRAETAGAEVLRLTKNAGKGAALSAGLTACHGSDDDILLLLDADLAESAAQGELLLTPLLAGTADLTIARFPKAIGKAGFGLVKGLARCGCWVLTGRWLQAPISGQRACRRWVLTSAPLANDYGLEVAMNIAASDAGARIHEVPVQMTHNVTGRNLRGFQHRGRQFLQIASALCSAALGRTGQPLLGPTLQPARVLLWLSAMLCAAYLAQRSAGLTPVVVSALLGIPLAAIASGIFHARKPNFQRRYIPSLGGLMLLPALLCYGGSHSLPTYWLSATLLAWLLLGMLDDVVGAGQRKGFRGHLGAIWHGQLTTGGAKLLFGGMLAFVMAYCLPTRGLPHWLAILPAALLIALSANALNLFDLRPGRALKVCWLWLLPFICCYWLQHGHSTPLSVILLTLAIQLLACTLLYAPLDFAGMMMLGDTGSNVLGAFLGLLLAVTLPFYAQCLALLPLIALHIYAERASISTTIERTGWLRWLDELGRDTSKKAEL